LRPKVDQTAGRLKCSLPHTEITETERNTKPTT